MSSVLLQVVIAVFLSIKKSQYLSQFDVGVVGAFCLFFSFDFGRSDIISTNIRILLLMVTCGLLFCLTKEVALDTLCKRAWFLGSRLLVLELGSW